MDPYVQQQIQASQDLQQGLQELVDNAQTQADADAYQRELDRQQAIQRNLYNA